MARFKAYLPLVFAFLWSAGCGAQSNLSDSKSTQFSATEKLNKRLTIGAVALETSALVGLNQLWYADYPRQSFHFYNDASNWQGMDKWGHAYSAYQLTRILHEVFSSPSVQSRKPMLKSALFSASFMTAIEVMDGFSSEWGFSWGDMGANAAGLALYTVQQSVFERSIISMKFSYRPSIYAEYRPSALGGNVLEQLFKDYNAQQYWLTYNSPAGGSKQGSLRWWKLLRPSIGFGAGGMLAGAPNHPVYASYPAIRPHQRFMLSFDVDWQQVHVKRPWAKTAITLLKAIKIPAPTLIWMPNSGTFQLAPVYF